MFKLKAAQKTQNAFTIVELTIAISIISILLSAVLYSRSLINQNKLLVVVGEYQKLKLAFADFNKIYNAVPGDMEDAYDFFGSDCGGDDTIANGGCNGDGDDSIENSDEAYKSTQHLALAKLLKGEYSGSSSSGAVADRFVKSHYDVAYYAPLLDSGVETNSYRGRFDKFHYVVLGAINSSSEPYDPVLTGAEAYLIDSKVDDGLIWNGVVQVRYNDASSCNGADSILTGSYDMEATTNICNLLFYIDAH